MCVARTGGRRTRFRMESVQVRTLGQGQRADCPLEWRADWYRLGTVGGCGRTERKAGGGGPEGWGGAVEGKEDGGGPEGWGGAGEGKEDGSTKLGLHGGGRMSPCGS